MHIWIKSTICKMRGLAAPADGEEERIMSREQQIAAEVRARLDAEEQQRQLALQVAAMPVPSGPPRNADGGYDWHSELEQRQKQRLEESRRVQASYEARERAEVAQRATMKRFAEFQEMRRREAAAAEWAAFKRWDASKGHDTNYNEYGWPTT
jgi:hypothetical protein